MNNNTVTLDGEWRYPEGFDIEMYKQYQKTIHFHQAVKNFFGGFNNINRETLNSNFNSTMSNNNMTIQEVSKKIEVSEKNIKHYLEDGAIPIEEAEAILKFIIRFN